MEHSRNYVLKVAIALLCAVGIHMPSFGYVRNAAARLSHGTRLLRPQIRFQHANNQNPESLASRVKRLKDDTEAAGRSVDSLGRWLRVAQFATTGLVAGTAYVGYRTYELRKMSADIIAEENPRTARMKEEAKMVEAMLTRLGQTEEEAGEVSEQHKPNMQRVATLNGELDEIEERMASVRGQVINNLGETAELTGQAAGVSQ